MSTSGRDVSATNPPRINNLATFRLTHPVFLQFSSTMGAIYEEHKDEDGFLYIAYSGENTFGQ
jgi:hypothetical protein